MAAARESSWSACAPRALRPETRREGRRTRHVRTSHGEIEAFDERRPGDVRLRVLCTAGARSVRGRKSSDAGMRTGPYHMTTVSILLVGRHCGVDVASSPHTSSSRTSGARTAESGTTAISLAHRGAANFSGAKLNSQQNACPLRKVGVNTVGVMHF